ncbi:hypothetical protein POV27_08345 [Aureisphaera galaxeae]|uniref:hypothetical protein n=1 Tax=Aureisphaera galaxeae TaxID=1538023 RepID=UPI002350C742|nr:hypothetical protein [Aureisphaera galaxeae]MDC8004060.1 hypothetical protein [Aureisphaera galaxeae]
MKQKDDLDLLFERLEGTFDLQETPEGHQKRFLQRLEGEDQDTIVPLSTKGKRRSLWKPLSIAASILLLISAGLFFQKDQPEDPQVEGLASVSPEMEETQSFFVSVINEELETLKSFESEDTKKLVDDALARMEVLETEYDSLKIDLVESGNDKRVIAAMIANFQNRIELLQQVIETIEEIETLKANRNEITI